MIGVLGPRRINRQGKTCLELSSAVYNSVRRFCPAGPLIVYSKLRQSTICMQRDSSALLLQVGTAPDGSPRRSKAASEETALKVTVCAAMKIAAYRYEQLRSTSLQ